MVCPAVPCPHHFLPWLLQLSLSGNPASRQMLAYVVGRLSSQTPRWKFLARFFTSRWSKQGGDISATLNLAFNIIYSHPEDTASKSHRLSDVLQKARKGLGGERGFYLFCVQRPRSPSTLHCAAIQQDKLLGLWYEIATQTKF